MFVAFGDDDAENNGQGIQFHIFVETPFVVGVDLQNTAASVPDICELRLIYVGLVNFLSSGRPRHYPPPLFSPTPIPSHQYVPPSLLPGQHPSNRESINDDGIRWVERTNPRSGNGRINMDF